MLFTEPLFLFLFLPALLAIYFASPRWMRNSILLTASFLFYAWGEMKYVIVLLTSILLNYWLGRLIDRDKNVSRRLIVWLGIAANLILLGAFKYPSFIVLNFNRLLAVFRLNSLAVPLSRTLAGSSFVTLMGMSYVIDVYRKQIKSERRFSVFLLYLMFFPYVIAGPIVRFAGIADDLIKRQNRVENFALGIRRFIVGMGKKTLIASTLALTVDRIFTLPIAELTPGLAWLGAASYALQLYFDISGYADMAIGLGYMFGFGLPENFNYPYISQSLTDFWRRWHMTLVAWFRDYLFFPLSYRRPMWLIHLNLVLVFVLCGLWHEGSWKFIVWGFTHGGLLSLERLGLGRWIERLPRALRHLYLLFWIVSTGVFVRAPSLKEAYVYFNAMVGIQSGAAATNLLSEYFNPMFLLAFAAGILGCMPLIPSARKWQKELSDRLGGSRGVLVDVGFRAFNLASLAVIFVGSASLSAAGTYSPFIYFKF